MDIYRVIHFQSYSKVSYMTALPSKALPKIAGGEVISFLEILSRVDIITFQLLASTIVSYSMATGQMLLLYRSAKQEGAVS